MGYNLEQAMKEYCPCCGRGEEAAIQYVKEYKGDPVDLYKEVLALGESVAGDFISIILASDYNVFTPWYKALLVYYKEHGESGIEWEAEDIYDLYKEMFDKVGDLHEV